MGLPAPASFPKIFIPQYFYESLGIRVGREELTGDYCIQIMP